MTSNLHFIRYPVSTTLGTYWPNHYVTLWCLDEDFITALCMDENKVDLILIRDAQ